MLTLSNDDPVAVALVQAVHAGDVERLTRLLAEHDGLVSAWIVDSRATARSSLHVATDWPGYFPSGGAVVELLLRAGADPNAAIDGRGNSETPLHWAASSDDVDVADALIDGGADLEAPGASIAGGAPLDNAVGYGCWHVARRLVERGARVEQLWHAAALGMRERFDELVAASPETSPDEINQAFWQACHGGQRRMADYLLARGADVNWVPDYAAETPLDIAGSVDTRRDTLVTSLRARGARSAGEP